MLKAVIVDASAVARGLLNTVLTEGSYDVVGMTHTAPLGYLMVQKHQPHVFCIALDQVEDALRAFPPYPTVGSPAVF